MVAFHLLTLRFKVLFQQPSRLLRVLMQDGPPAARRAGLDVFRPVINVDQIRAAFAGHGFHGFIDFGLRLHRADFVGQNVTVEIFEERKIPADMLDGQVVRVGKNISLETALGKLACKAVIGAISVKISAK